MFMLVECSFFSALASPMPRHAHCILIQNILWNRSYFPFPWAPADLIINYCFGILLHPQIILRGSYDRDAQGTYKKTQTKEETAVSGGECGPIARAIEWGLRNLSVPRDIGEILYVYTIRASPFMHFARSFGHVSCTTNAPLPHHNYDMGPVVVPCPGFFVSMRRQGGTIRMTIARGWASCGRLKQPS